MAVEELIDVFGMAQDFHDWIKELEDASKEDDVVPNPHFIANGITGRSPVTRHNLFKRRLKRMAGVGVSVAGFVGGKVMEAFTATDVNLGDVAKHGTSTVTTGVHLYRFLAMAKKVRDGGSLSRHIELMIRLKGLKAGSRAMQTACAAIPLPGVDVVGAAVGLGHDLALKKMKYVLQRTATDIHWQAYRELKLLGAQGESGSGPALRIWRELTCFGVGSMHSVSENNKIIREPGGWNVLHVKLGQT
jgi:hypothetical protein